MILSRAWEMYEMDKKMGGYSQHTLKAYRLQTKLMIRHFGDVSISGLQYEDLKVYIAKDFDRLKAGTISHRVRYIKSFYKWAVEEDHVDKNPARKLKEPKEGIRLPKLLEKEEVEILKSVCQTPLENALFRILYATGSRIGEIHKLNIDDLNLSERTVVVNGKGNKERTVFFNIECKVWLETYLRSRIDHCESLFVTERCYPAGTEPIRASIAQLRYVVKRVAKRTNIESSIYPHRLRHSLASHMFANDAPLSLIQTILGHEKSETTQIYVHADPSRTKKLYDKYS